MNETSSSSMYRIKKMIIYSMIHHQMLIMNTGVAMMFIKPDIYKNCHMEFYVR